AARWATYAGGRAAAGRGRSARRGCGRAADGAPRGAPRALGEEEAGVMAVAPSPLEDRTVGRHRRGAGLRPKETRFHRFALRVRYGDTDAPRPARSRGLAPRRRASPDPGTPDRAARIRARTARRPR